MKEIAVVVLSLTVRDSSGALRKSRLAQSYELIGILRSLKWKTLSIERASGEHRWH
jgi:hypothetical protein